MKLLSLAGLALLTVCGSASSADQTAQKIRFVDSKPVATTSLGAVEGSSGEVLSFKGIPFAQPPVGELRWRPPVNPQPWASPRSALEFGPACMQKAAITKSEDCLYINVWTPRTAAASGQKLPVMVWVFGGSFDSGSGNIDGTELARKGAVIVSMNYRVGTFGFLAHPQLSAESADKVSGNYGLLDVHKSLEWVQQNIQNFGGDEKNVTLWGVSAGASTITALMSSPRSRGLFQKAILESPGAFRHWQSLDAAERQGVKLGPDIAALRQRPTEDIPLITNTGGGTAFRALSIPRIIGPTQDGVILPHEERPTFEAGKQVIVPTLLGNNTDEATLFTGNYPAMNQDDYQAYLSNPNVFGAFGPEAFRVYPASTAAEIKSAIAQSFGDSQFWFGTRGIARAQAKAGMPVYRYYFKRKGKGGIADAQHADEVAYVFGDAKLSKPPYTPEDQRLSADMMDAWVRFAATGNPNGGAIHHWPQYEIDKENTYVLDAMQEIESAPHGEQLDFIGRFDSSIPGR